MKNKKTWIGAGVLVLVAGFIVAALLLGQANTIVDDHEEGEKEPARFENVVGFEGQYRADDIRGSYTLGHISQLFEVPLEHLSQAFELSEEQAENTACKDLETRQDGKTPSDTQSVRYFVASYLGQPITVGDKLLLSQTAKDIVLTHGKPSLEQRTFLQNLETPQPSTDPTGTAPTTYTGIDLVVEVKGSARIKDVASQYGIPLQDFVQAFGLSLQEGNTMQVRDVKTKFAGSEKEIGTGSVKLFVACYKGANYDLGSTDAFLTQTGASVVKTKGNPTQQQLDYLLTHTVV